VKAMGVDSHGMNTTTDDERVMTMQEEPNYAETSIAPAGRIRASYMVPGYVGQTTTGEPTYVFHKAATEMFRGDAVGEADAWAWLAGVAADHGRVLSDLRVRQGLAGTIVVVQAVTVSAGVTA